MTTRKIILGGIVVALVAGIGNFAYNGIVTRQSLGLIAKGGADATTGTQQLLSRGTLFDALQGGAPPKTRLAAIEALTNMAEGGKDEKAFGQLLQMLKDPDTESTEKKTHPVRDAAKDAVAKVGPSYPEKLLDAAKDADGNIRDQSREALKKIGAPLQEKMAARLGDGGLRAPLGDILSGIGPTTIPLIVPWLSPAELDKFKDKPDDLNKAKIELIEMLGKFKVAEAARPLLPFKDDPNPNVRRAVVTSLANIGDPVGESVLMEALADQNADASARAAASGALGGIATPEANAAMAKALADYDIAVAKQAAAGLHRAGDSAATAIAQGLAISQAPAVRARAAEAAGGQRTTTLAIKALSDPAPEVRSVAATSLGDILASANVIQDALKTLTTASDVAAREEALKTLQTRGALLEVLRPGAPAGAKTAAIGILQAQANAQAKDDAKKPFLDQMATLNDPVVIAREAKRAPLANGTTAAALAPLIKALGDSDGDVTIAAQTALVRIGQPAVPALVTLLSNSQDTIAYFASQALAQIGTSAVDALLPVAQVGKPSARWAAITLGDIGDARAASSLQALTSSPDPDTAYAAQTALAKVKPG